MKPTATASRPRPVRRSRARAAAGALLVAAALAGVARAAPQGDPPSALETAVRTHVAGALPRDGGAPTDDALARLEGRLGRGPYLLPFLAEHFEDPARGLAAMAFAARLEGVDADALARAVASSGRRDRPFLERAASALAGACASGELLARARTWCGGGAGPLRDAAVMAMPRSEEGCAAVASLLGCGDGRTAALAMEWLLTGPGAGLDRLLEALAVERLGPEARRAAMDGLLSARSALLPWIVPRIAADPQLVDLALNRPLPEGRRDEIVAELLAMPPFPSTDTWMSALLGLGRPLEGRGLRRFALGRRAFEPVAARTARRAAPAGTVREELRLHLPSSGLRLDGAADVAAVLERALPVHAPFLAASADLAPWPHRARVALRVRELGHPAGVEILLGGAHDDDPAVRRAAVVVLGKLGADGAQAVRDALDDPDPGVLQVALDALGLGGIDLPPERGLDLLGRIGGAGGRAVRLAMGRHADRAALHDAVWRVLDPAAEDPPVVRDLDGLARWFLLDVCDRPVLALRCLHHEEAVVRARAAEAVAAGRRPAGRKARELVSDVENLARDGDPVVRAQAARALGSVRHDLARTVLVFLTQDSVPFVREAAVAGLGLQESYHVIPVLRRAVRDADSWVRGAARIALLRHGVLDEVPGVLNALDHPVLGFAARRALGELIATPCSSRDEFVRALDEERPEWRRDP